MSVTHLWTLRAHKDASATKPATTQTAAARFAADVDTISWNRHAVSAAIAGSTGVATCCVRSVASRSGLMCASRFQSRSQLPLPTQDSRWRACPFAHSCCLSVCFAPCVTLPENLFILPPFLFFSSSSGIYFLFVAAVILIMPSQRLKRWLMSFVLPWSV